MALLIPIPQANKESLLKALDRVAPYNWADLGKIHVFEIDAQETAVALYEYCQSNGIQDVLIPSRLHCDERALQEAGYNVINGPSINNLVHGDGLEKHLGRLRLDWRSELSAQVGRYGLGTVAEPDINRWLGQFERLGNHRPVGEHLLQLVEVVSLADLGNSLCADADFYGANLVVGFNNDKWGKSWSIVSNLIGKKCTTATLLPIAEAVERSGHPNILRLVEDGLFSGTETRAVFDSLRGTRRSGRSQKVPKLDDPTILSRISAQIYFGAVCDFGEAVLRRYMATNSLLNVHITISAAVRKIRVLLQKPMVLSVNEVLPQNEDKLFREALLSRVVPFALQDDKGWKDENARQRARAFCENVGEQLWRAYLTKKNFDLASWPEDRIKLCALGMEGLGLTLAFPHSVPKASLPLFWARGKVTLNGVSLNWTPLFPDADT